MSDPGYPARSIEFHFVNCTSATFTLQDASLTQGFWSPKKGPPKTLEPATADKPSKNVFTAESLPNSTTGVQGSLSYGLSDGTTIVALSFENPWNGKNQYDPVYPPSSESIWNLAFEAGPGDNAKAIMTFSGA